MGLLVGLLVKAERAAIRQNQEIDPENKVMARRPKLVTIRPGL
ncbi:MAG TPA: hypothetical protein VMA37_10025 [Acetobacteraceae bacterium]|nr:hypothetical protein [Acetobacteraceae bacterium]